MFEQMFLELTVFEHKSFGQMAFEQVSAVTKSTNVAETNDFARKWSETNFIKLFRGKD